MLPEGGLSTTPIEGRLIHDISEEVSPHLDFKPGGINIQDPTKGLDYQIWRGRLLNPESNRSKIVIDGRYSPEMTLLEYPHISEFSFSFDFTMRPMAVFVANEIEQIGNQQQLFKNTYLYWFDNTLGRYALIFLGSVIRTPKILVDDARENESGFYSKSDVCLFYWRSGSLYVRYLRDRFTEETLLKRNIPYIESIGMNEHYRLQFNLIREVDECENSGVLNDCTNRK